MKLTFRYRMQAVEGTIDAVKMMLAGEKGEGVQWMVKNVWLRGDVSPESIRRYARKYVKENLAELEKLADKIGASE